MPFALGAICLNPVGLTRVKELKPFKSLLKLFCRDEYLRSLLDEDVATFLGHATDELIRHHPDLKQDIMDSIKELMEEILKIGSNFGDTLTAEEKNKLPLTLHFASEPNVSEVKLVDAEVKSEEHKEIPVVNYIDSTARVSPSRF